MGKGAFLGEFEQMVLLAILRLEETAYGVRVRQTIEERTGRSVTVGAMYAALDRLERKKYVRSEESEPEPIRGGRAKRIYGVTAAGARALAHSQAMMRNMAEGLALDRERGV